MSRPQHMICPSCGAKHIRNAQWRWGDYCSYDCYLSMPFPKHPHISAEEIQRVCRMYKYQNMAANALDVSYVQFRRVVKKLNLRGMFPADWRTI